MTSETPLPATSSSSWTAVTVTAAGLLVATLLVAEPAARSAAADGEPFLRGMTVSCQGYGRIWGSGEMTETLAELSRLGVGWASIHPYAGVRRDGSVRFEPAARTGYLGRAVEMARAAAVELFWKPHLAYWGSFEWRGEIAFGDEEARWRRFFVGYQAFILDQARFAEAAMVPLFAVLPRVRADPRPRGRVAASDRRGTASLLRPHHLLRQLGRSREGAALGRRRSDRRPGLLPTELQCSKRGR